MPGIEEGDMYIARNFQRVVVSHTNDALKGIECIIFRVEWSNWCFSFLGSFLVSISHVKLLYPARIG
ncbi:MAG: hypothetical protein BWY63_02843 [Chloroflexi bacterium ADurb.Bin360]|nr:MAG: hypothetical protein BWY63_02843 [Chloroflexi bacterium ADurb.Bin360]